MSSTIMSETFEPHHEKVSDRIQHKQPEKMALGLRKQRDCTFYVVKNKGTISCAVNSNG